MSEITQQDAAAGDVTLTGDAARRIAFLMQQEGENAKLRIEVQGGGCSGFSYVEDLMAAAFRIENPNASSACGCGTSFAI